MKKICLLIVCALLTTNVAIAANYCTQAGGSLITDVPRTAAKGGTMTLCQSGHKMNFWSAVAWCDAIGGRIINYNDLEISGTKVVNLSGYFSTVDSFWTGIRKSATLVVEIYNGGGSQFSDAPSGSHKALCVMD